MERGTNHLEREKDPHALRMFGLIRSFLSFKSNAVFLNDCVHVS